MLDVLECKNTELPIEEQYKIVKSLPDYHEKVFRLSNAKYKEEYLICGVQVKFNGKKKAFVNGQEIVGEDRLDLLSKIGNILREEYEVSNSALWGFYNVVRLR